MSAAEIVENLRDRWSAAFAARDLDALAALYTRDALFFGSTPELYCGRDGVRKYFATLQSDVTLASFAAPEIVEAVADAIVTAGKWNFHFGDELRRYRLTWTVVRREGEWLIAAHHASRI